MSSPLAIASHVNAKSSQVIGVMSDQTASGLIVYVTTGLAGSLSSSSGSAVRRSWLYSIVQPSPSGMVSYERGIVVTFIIQ